MIRIRRVLIIPEVASHASSIDTSKVVILVDMASGAGKGGVEARQREARRRVIELSVGPCHRVVAAFARSGEAQLNVV